MNGNSYYYELIVVNQDDVIVSTGKLPINVSYSTYNLDIKPIVNLINSKNAVKVQWANDRKSEGKATGIVSYVSDFPFTGTNSVNIQSGTIVYDSIQNLPLNIDEYDFSIVIDININSTKTGKVIELYKPKQEIYVNSNYGEKILIEVLPEEIYGVKIRNNKFYSYKNNLEKELLSFSIPSGQSKQFNIIMTTNSVVVTQK